MCYFLFAESISKYMQIHLKNSRKYATSCSHSVSVLLQIVVQFYNKISLPMLSYPGKQISVWAKFPEFNLQVFQGVQSTYLFQLAAYYQRRNLVYGNMYGNTQKFWLNLVMSDSCKAKDGKLQTRFASLNIIGSDF